jgi:hypothetical protein
MKENLKLPGHTPGLPGNAFSLHIVPLAPPVPIDRDGTLFGQGHKNIFFTYLDNLCFDD